MTSAAGWSPTPSTNVPADLHGVLPARSWLFLRRFVVFVPSFSSLRHAFPWLIGSHFLYKGELNFELPHVDLAPFYATPESVSTQARMSYIFLLPYTSTTPCDTVSEAATNIIDQNGQRHGR